MVRVVRREEGREGRGKLGGCEVGCEGEWEGREGSVKEGEVGRVCGGSCEGRRRGKDVALRVT